MTDILEGSSEVYVNEYGELVDNKGKKRKIAVKLKPRTFY